MRSLVPCFVLGLFDTGLAVVRALGRSGVPVLGFDHDCNEYGFRSKFGHHTPSPHPRRTAQLTAFLIDRARSCAERPILYPTSDAFVMFVSEHRDELEPHFRLALPPRASVSIAINKAAMHAFAADARIPIPCTHTPQTLDEVARISTTVAYPVVVKPLIGHLWREAYRGEKAIRVNDGGTLLELFRQILAAGQSALVQSLVTGPNTNHYKVCGYFDANGQARAVICMRKIRQHPVDFGVGTLMETVVEPEVRELGLRLFRALNWRGPGSIEFKRDDRDGRVKLIELNPRLWQQHALATVAGMNFPMLQYLDMTGQPATVETYRAGVRWLDEFRDPRSAWEHRRRGALTLGEWAESFRGVRAFALWAHDDPAPFLAAARHHLWRAGRRVSGVRQDA
jgi:D-aspartate ligase